MDSEKRIAVNIINRNYPPSSGITGKSAAELAKYLCDEDFTVNVIHTDSSYNGGCTSVPAGTVYKVRSFYQGKNKLLRLFENLWEGFCLVKTSKKIACDVTICMTDPPLLNMWASLLLKNKKWILWAMDIYPDAFVADKLVSSQNIIYKIIKKLTIFNRPQYIIALGPVQSEYLQNINSINSDSIFCLPCGIYDSQQDFTGNLSAWVKNDGKILLGYCGNLGEAHSLEFLFAVVDNFDPKKFKLILSVYGSHAKELQKYIQGREGIESVPFISREYLRFIDIHLASLKKEWVNICVPSKTVSSVCAGSAFLYYGPKYSDNWVLLKNAGWLIPIDEDVQEEVKKFFIDFRYEELACKKIEAKKIAKKLNNEKEIVFGEIAKTINKKSNI